MVPNGVWISTSGFDISFFGNLPYDVLQPVSFNGAYYYLRATYSFAN